MIGFWQKPEDTANTIINGWVHTGDVGYCDEKGYIYIVDRKRDMIISGGENVYSREVETILYQHPAVAECAVIGVPDPYWVEHVHGVVVLKKGAKLTPEELIAFCKKRLGWLQGGQIGRNRRCFTQKLYGEDIKERTAEKVGDLISIKSRYLLLKL